MSKKESKRILEGYSRNGSRYIPSILRKINFQETNYILETLPEIIWIGLINDTYGSRDGLQLYAKLAIAAKKIHNSKHYRNFALCSSYAALTPDEISRVIGALGVETHNRLKKSLDPLTILYKEFPLSFIGKSEQADEKNILIKKIRQCVESHYDRFATTTLIALASISYVGLSTGIMHYAYAPPNFEEIIKNPDCEILKAAAGHIRTSAMQIIARAGELHGHIWARSFWNQGLKIDSCLFEEMKSE